MAGGKKVFDWGPRAKEAALRQRVERLGGALRKGEKKLKTLDWREQSKNLVFHHEMSKFTKTFKDNFVTLIISSLGLLVALSWNNFWNAWVATLTVENNAFYKFYVALAMTILAVVLTYVLTKLKSSQ